MAERIYPRPPPPTQIIAFNSPSPSSPQPYLSFHPLLSCPALEFPIGYPRATVFLGWLRQSIMYFSLAFAPLSRRRAFSSGIFIVQPFSLVESLAHPHTLRCSHRATQQVLIIVDASSTKSDYETIAVNLSE